MRAHLAQITDLSLSCLGFGAQGAGALAELLCSARSEVQLLSVRGNTIGGGGLFAISAALLRRRGAATSLGGKLVFLNAANIGVNGSHTKALTRFGQAARETVSLTAVDFNYNPIGAAGGTALIQGLYNENGEEEAADADEEERRRTMAGDDSSSSAAAVADGRLSAASTASSSRALSSAATDYSGFRPPSTPYSIVSSRSSSRGGGGGGSGGAALKHLSQFLVSSGLPAHVFKALHRAPKGKKKKKKKKKKKGKGGGVVAPDLVPDIAKAMSILAAQIAQRKREQEEREKGKR